MNDLRDGLVLEVDLEVSIGRLLVRVVDAGEALDLARSSLLVEAGSVSLLAVLERGGDVDEEKSSSGRSASGGDEVSGGLSGGGVRSGGRGDDGGTGSGELSLEKRGGRKLGRQQRLPRVVRSEIQKEKRTATKPIRLTFLSRSSAEKPSSDGNESSYISFSSLNVMEGDIKGLTRRELVPDGLSEQQRDGPSSMLGEDDLERLGNGVLSRVVETGEHDGETLLVSGRVRLSEDLDD
jgi:hypothetical protein